MLIPPPIVGVVTHVVDADTFDIGATRFRLHYVDGNERDGSCHDHGCAPLGYSAARAVMMRAVLGKAVTCILTGRVTWHRLEADCSVGGRDIACMMVRAGATVVWRKYDPEGVFEGRCR